MGSPYKTRHRTIDIDGTEIFYRQAGDPEKPAILLLHGYPSSSHMFRNVIEPLAESMHVIAPDLPGFGFSDAPPADQYDYTFDNLSHTIERFLDAIAVNHFFVYHFDFGTPVAYHLASRHPDRIRGLIVQNGNAHEAGLGPQWDAPRAFWSDPTPENRAKLGEWMNFEGNRAEYIGGLPERLAELYPPECWHLDWDRLSRPGNVEIQFRIFCDYQNHVARFPAIESYHREHQPPCLLLWGRHDAYFDLDEIMAYSRVLDSLEIHVFDSGHFLLETHHTECSRLITDFVSNVEASCILDKGTKRPEPA
ncbi:alpha/beta fold hydrolase [Microbacterium abyssi]|uniref:alpha/beta fold hydrolase n=1 Tax=Microbacterium abyssi TaxID=2782166 RepID=UPI001887EF6C|nr:alpha/beta hydrolase [Microbacterium sp. A18JL241]